MSNLRISPLGTCRIHTPLRRAAGRYPIEVDLRRNYGFVHTSSEALQLLRFLQGEKKFRPEVSPLIFRDADPAKFEAEQWEPAELHIVEISSAKLISSGPDVVQGNYVQRHFPDFFASNRRSREYWGLVKKGNRQDLIEFLEQQPSYHLLSQSDRDLLASLTMDQQSFKAIKSDMAEMVERLGADKLLFVTHVNATTPDGELIPSRDRLIRWVKLAGDQLGVHVFDPTPVMEEFGQERALEDGGIDLTHFTLAFSDGVYDAMHQLHIAEMTHVRGLETGVDDERQKIGRLAARLEAMLELGDFFAASRAVHSALDQSPGAAPLIELRGLIRSRIGDYSGALEDLTVRGDESLLSQSMRVGLLEALSNTGHYDRALAVAEDLLGEEFESARIYRAAATAAEESGQPDVAARYAKQAFRMDRSDLPTGLRALVLLIEKGEQAETAEWRGELLENIGKNSSGAFELASWALRHRDEELFTAAFTSGAMRDKAGSIDLLEDAFGAAMFHAVARAIPVAVSLGRLSPALSERRTALIDKAVAEIAPLFEGGRTGEAYELARGIMKLSDIPSSQVASARLAGEARRLTRQMTQHVRIEVREAFARKAMEEVVRIGDAAGDILIGDPNTATIVARAMHDVGRSADALALLRATLAENPDSFHARRWTGRVAAQLGEYAIALESYSTLSQMLGPELRTAKPEVDRFFASVERRALKKLRELVDSGRDDEALELAEAITRHLGALERTDRELARLHRSLREQLREIDQAEVDLDEREAILRRLVRVKPDDQSSLRRLALELMRQIRFAEAAEVWDRIHILDPENESADRNRVRCATLAERRASESGAEVGEMA